jgi:hypothetical protein
MAEPLDRRHATSALKDLLERGTGKPVYWGGDVPQAAGFPFVVVEPATEGRQWAPTLADDYTSPECRFLVKCAGRRQDQAEALADRVRKTVLQRDASGAFEVQDTGLPAGWYLKDRCTEGYQGVEHAGSSPNVVWTAIETFALYLTAA